LPVAPDRSTDHGFARGYGRIIDESHAPIAGVTIGAPAEVDLEGRSEEPGLRLDDAAPITTTDEDGAFIVQPAPPEIARRARAPGFGPALIDRATLGGSVASARDVVLAREARFVASVRDTKDRAVEGALVRVFTYAKLALRSEGAVSDALDERCAVEQATT